MKTLEVLIATVFISLFALLIIHYGGGREYICKKQSPISKILSTSSKKTTVRLEDGSDVTFGSRDLNLGAAVCQNFDIYLTPFWSDEAILLDENVTRAYLISN